MRLQSSALIVAPPLQNLSTFQVYGPMHGSLPPDSNYSVKSSSRRIHDNVFTNSVSGNTFVNGTQNKDVHTWSSSCIFLSLIFLFVLKNGRPNMKISNDLIYWMHVQMILVDVSKCTVLRQEDKVLNFSWSGLSQSNAIILTSTYNFSFHFVTEVGFVLPSPPPFLFNIN